MFSLHIIWTVNMILITQTMQMKNVEAVFSHNVVNLWQTHQAILAANNKAKVWSCRSSGFSTSKTHFTEWLFPFFINICTEISQKHNFTMAVINACKYGSTTIWYLHAESHSIILFLLAYQGSYEPKPKYLMFIYLLWWGTDQIWKSGLLVHHYY